MSSSARFSSATFGTVARSFHYSDTANVQALAREIGDVIVIGLKMPRRVIQRRAQHKQTD